MRELRRCPKNGAQDYAVRDLLRYAAVRPSLHIK